MKERRKGFIAGVLASTIFMGLVGTAAATVGSRTLTADYNNIKISVNGSTITPTDANGNVVEPFAINGTTYLPVRAVSNALGISVDWNGNTNTVLLSKADGQNALNILKLLDLCATTKNCISDQKGLNQAVSNYISLSFSANSSSQVQDIKTAIQDLTEQLPGCLASIFLIQNEINALQSQFEGTPFYYYCDELKMAAESMMEAYEYQTASFENAKSYCDYKEQIYFDNYISNINSSSTSLGSAEYTYDSVYNGVYSEAVKELG